MIYDIASSRCPHEPNSKQAKQKSNRYPVPEREIPKQFQCEYCYKSFNLKYSLKRHLNLHVEQTSKQQLPEQPSNPFQ